MIDRGLAGGAKVDCGALMSEQDVVGLGES